MNVIKNQKGITIVYVIITVIILLILSAIAVETTNNSNNTASYNKMIADITLLEDKILVYYNKNGEAPIVSDTEEEIAGVSYSKIDLTKLENITLNFGNNKETNDYYLIDNNLKVYYKKGIEKSGQICHTKE